ncbi:hypothetical protein [Rhabdochromatium marinum]|uniref:hypothetical protein n=1 Tax=Rhabdochromatium marinum TaxID=48729 RepID=UPI0019086E5A|nr:hypothetical protein [Rhabdochromatium marinum]MBK1649700.1 hypothetical protein [Rhabdochromatium marinum]
MTTTATTSDDSAGSVQLEAWQLINQRLEEAVKREEDLDYRHSQSNQRTQLIGRVALVVMLLLTPPIFYLIWSLVGSMGVITYRMESMYGEIDVMQRDFDQVAARITNIKTGVSQMNDHIAVMPPMATRLQGMRHDIGAIAGAMGRISPDVASVSQTIIGIDQHMGEMNQAFSVLNRDMFRMRHNVNQMSSPMRMMPFFGQ